VNRQNKNKEIKIISCDRGYIFGKYTHPSLLVWNDDDDDDDDDDEAVIMRLHLSDTKDEL
jgi:hypothetical protein